MQTSKMILAFIAIFGAAALLDAQYVRINNADKVMPNSGMTPPTVLKSTLALYTDDARAHGIEGTVTIEAFIDEGGQIRSSRVFKSLGFGLDEVALASVQEWEFSPATRDGVPVFVVAQIDVQFSLRSANALRIGNGVTPPTVLSRVEPKYTKEASIARLNGTVVLQAVVKNNGTVDVIRVVRGLPYGMTDSAVEALKQWKFRPGKKDGQDVDAALNIEINFNLQ
jgi:TonB family protein